MPKQTRKRRRQKGPPDDKPQTAGAALQGMDQRPAEPFGPRGAKYPNKEEKPYDGNRFFKNPFLHTTYPESEKEGLHNLEDTARQHRS